MDFRNFLDTMGLCEVGLEEGDYMAYDLERNTIILNESNAIATFPHYCSFMEEYFGVDLSNVPPLWAAFLHEVGHSVTMEQFEPWALLFCKYQKEDMEDIFSYWRLPDEWAANEWVARHMVERV